MSRAQIPDRHGKATELDGCCACSLIWFDRSEVDRISGYRLEGNFLPVESGPSEREMAGAIATEWVDQERRMAALTTEPEYPDHFLELVLLSLGLPVDAEPLYPQSNGKVLIAPALIILLGSLRMRDPNQWGFVPAQAFRSLWPWFTSALAHGNWFHLIFNLVFLWIFGHWAQLRLKIGEILLVMLFANVTGNLAAALITPQSHVPIVGASGMIYGLFGAAVGLLPSYQVKTRLLMGLPVFIPTIAIQSFRMPIWIYASVMLLFQLILLVSQLLGTGDVSAIHHIFGFFGGMTAAWFLAWLRLKQAKPNKLA